MNTNAGDTRLVLEQTLVIIPPQPRIKMPLVAIKDPGGAHAKFRVGASDIWTTPPMYELLKTKTRSDSKQYTHPLRLYRFKQRKSAWESESSTIHCPTTAISILGVTRTFQALDVAARQARPLATAQKDMGHRGLISIFSLVCTEDDAEGIPIAGLCLTATLDDHFLKLMSLTFGEETVQNADPFGNNWILRVHPFRLVQSGSSRSKTLPFPIDAFVMEFDPIPSQTG